MEDVDAGASSRLPLLPQTVTVHAHRLDNTPSKLPTFRLADLQRTNSLPTQLPLPPILRQVESGRNSNSSESCSDSCGEGAAETLPTQHLTAQQAYATATQGGSTRPAESGKDNNNNSGPHDNSITCNNDNNHKTPSKRHSRIPQFPASLQRSNTVPVTNSPAITRTPGTRNSRTATTGTGTTPQSNHNNSPARQSRALSATPKSETKRSRRPPASYSSNGIETQTGPPPALSTQRSVERALEPSPKRQETQAHSVTEEPNSHKVSHIRPQEAAAITSKTSSNNDSIAKTEQQTASKETRKAVIPPIRSFRSSATRKSLGMDRESFYGYDGAGDQYQDEDDRDRTLRALEGNYREDSRTRRNTYSSNREELSPQRNNGDLFLDLALDDLSRQNSNESDDRDNATTITTATERRRSRVACPSARASFPTATPSSSGVNNGRESSQSNDREHRTTYSRVGAESQLREERNRYPPLSSHNRATSHPTGSPLDLSRGRYHSPSSRSPPTTPRIYNSRSDQISEVGSHSGRRGSIPEAGSHIRGHAYRQSNLSQYSTPRMYTSSPIAPRAADAQPMGVPTESTESTASTTAPSTVWDELDDLKSRIRKLELTGKLPTTSGAAVSHATGERPPTATTTATTLSMSPKRPQNAARTSTDETNTHIPDSEAHPLLHAALARSKAVLSNEVYKALENTASDALQVASMVGSTGQQMNMSSAQSIIGGGAFGGSIADRQLRRKAESMCRSLTELCIALSDAATQAQPPAPQTAVRPGSSGRLQQLQAEQQPDPMPRQLIQPGDTLTIRRQKDSPSRAMSTLEMRRSSMLNTTALPGPRFNPNGLGAELQTPSASTLAGRRTSMMLRSRQRAGTEERELGDEEETARFRAPSRAVTEVGMGMSPHGPGSTIGSRVPLRGSPRDYNTVRDQPAKLDGLQRTPSTVSALPPRRVYGGAASLTPASTMPNLSLGRRYLDRGTPERDVSDGLPSSGGSVVGSRSALGTRLTQAAEERANRLAAAQNGEGTVSRTRSVLGTGGGTAAATANNRLRARSNANADTNEVGTVRGAYA